MPATPPNSGPPTRVVSTAAADATATPSSGAAGHPLTAIRVTRQDLSGVDLLAAPAD